MTVKAMTLTDFLRERIAEDEAVARAVEADMPRWDDPDWERGSLEIGGGLPGPQHTARWSPARVLAECAAKRAIVGLHDAWESGEGSCYSPDYWAAPMDDVIRHLAAVHSDHPDYDEAWRP